MPLTLEIENDDAKWQRARSSADVIYAQIISDLEKAESRLWNKSKTGGEDMGRATKGAAQAMLVKVYMYMHNYTKAKEWGDKFLTDQASEYSLVPNFADNFTLSGENNAESIFEIQYANEGTSDFNPGNGATRGTFTTVLTRSRSTNMGDEGWGFNKPTHNLYNEYEEADSLRRDFPGLDTVFCGADCGEVYDAMKADLQTFIDTETTPEEEYAFYHAFVSKY